jgi:hypothetical protein
LDIKHIENSQETLGRLVEIIREAIENIFTGDASAKVKVQRWFPGVIEEIVEEVSEKTAASVTQRLMKEASFIALDRNKKFKPPRPKKSQSKIFLVEMSRQVTSHPKLL